MMEQKNKDPEDTKGILRGAKEIFVHALGMSSIENLNQITACRDIDPPPEEELWGDNLVRKIYDKISKNVEYSGAGATNSKENWRLDQQTCISDHNKGKEVLLERAIAVLSKGGVLQGWCNQVPVASGLIPNRGRRAAIDLVRILDDNAFEFIELKWKSNNPIFAAFEILGYGLVYLYSRHNTETLGYDRKKIKLFEAKVISLHVLAPYKFYSKFDLAWLECGLSHGIATLAEKLTNGALSMDFKLFTFAEDFDHPFSNGAEVSALHNASADHPQVSAIVSALEDVRPVRFVRAWKSNSEITPPSWGT